jgi:hypothetical protein
VWRRKRKEEGKEREPSSPTPSLSLSGPFSPPLSRMGHAGPLPSPRPSSPHPAQLSPFRSPSRAPALSSLPFSLCQAGPAHQRPFPSSPFFSGATAPRSPASSSSPGPHAKVAPLPYIRGTPTPSCPRTLPSAATRTSQHRSSFLRRANSLGLIVEPPFRRALDHHSPRQSSASSPRSLPSHALEL